MKKNLALGLLCLLALSVATKAQDKKDKEGEPQKTYWLGVALAEPSELLKTHLRLEGGALIAHVFPGSPAEKAGLKKDDILVKFGGRKLEGSQDLVDTVAQSQGEKQTLELISAGRKKTITVQPAPRPEKSVRQPPANDDQAVGKALEWLQKHGGQAGNIPPNARPFAQRWFFAQPGIVLPQGRPDGKNFPANTAVTIKKEGDKPAQIVIKRDGKEWSVTEEKIDQLPKDLQPLAKNMLRQGSAARMYRLEWAQPKFGKPAEIPPVGGVLRIPQLPEFNDPQAAKMLDQMRKEMEQMRKKMEKDFAPGNLQKQLDELRKELESVKGKPEA